jgi:hypothetical protein
MISAPFEMSYGVDPTVQRYPGGNKKAETSQQSGAQSPQGIWKLARWARKRGEKAATTTPTLTNP